MERDDNRETCKDQPERDRDSEYVSDKRRLSEMIIETSKEQPERNI